MRIVALVGNRSKAVGVVRYRSVYGIGVCIYLFRGINFTKSDPDKGDILLIGKRVAPTLLKSLGFLCYFIISSVGGMEGVFDGFGLDGMCRLLFSWTMVLL